MTLYDATHLTRPSTWDLPEDSPTFDAEHKLMDEAFEARCGTGPEADAYIAWMRDDNEEGAF